MAGIPHGNMDVKDVFIYHHRKDTSTPLMDNRQISRTPKVRRIDFNGAVNEYIKARQ